MEQYGKILLIAMPFFLLLIVIEKIYGYFKGVNHAPMMDSIWIAYRLFCAIVIDEFVFRFRWNSDLIL